MDPKKPWTSTTLWANVLAIIAAIVLDRLGYIQHEEAVLIVIACAGNFGLRFKTDRPVKM